MKKSIIFGVLAIMMAISATLTFAQTTNTVESKISQALAYYDSLVGTQQVPAKDLEGFKAWVKKDREGFEAFLKNFFAGDTLKFTDWYDSYQNRSEKGEVTAAVFYKDGATTQVIGEKAQLKEVTPEELKNILKEYEPTIRENSLKRILKEYKGNKFQIAEGSGQSLSSAGTRVNNAFKLAGINPYSSSVFEFQKWGYREYSIVKIVVVK